LLWAVLSFAGRTAAGWALRQWPALVSLSLALILSFVTGFLRLHDNENAVVSDQSLDSSSFGLFLGLESAVTLTPKALPGLMAGIDTPKLRWTLDVEVGTPNRGTLSLVLFEAPGLWRLDLTQPVDVIVQLPDGGVSTQRKGALIAGPGSDRACASWSNGTDTSFVEPDIQKSSSGTTVLDCHIPAAGSISQLFVEIPFQWRDPVRTTVGFGRQESWLRVQDWLNPPGDVRIPNGSYNGLAQPLAVRLHVASGDRVIDAFPSPDGGGYSERYWNVERGGDIQYTVERPRDRALVAPAIDMSLLLAGVFFGLIPALWRGSPER
jgi:hypothetical protein